MFFPFPDNCDGIPFRILFRIVHGHHDFSIPGLPQQNDRRDIDRKSACFAGLKEDRTKRSALE